MTTSPRLGIRRDAFPKLAGPSGAVATLGQPHPRPRPAGGRPRDLLGLCPTNESPLHDGLWAPQPAMRGFDRGSGRQPLVRDTLASRAARRLSGQSSCDPTPLALPRSPSYVWSFAFASMSSWKSFEAPAFCFGCFLAGWASPASTPGQRRRR